MINITVSDRELLLLGHQGLGESALWIDLVTFGLHLFPLVLQSLLSELLFFLLRPAEIGTPEGKAVGDENVESADVECEPPVEHHSGAHAALALHENELGPGHQAGEREVENANPPSDLSQETAAADVVHEQQGED